MGVESEGEEEKVELSEGEVDVLEHEGAAGGAEDDDQGGLLPAACALTVKSAPPVPMTACTVARGRTKTRVAEPSPAGTDASTVALR